MLKLLIGFIVGVGLVLGGLFVYFAKGIAPVAVTDPPMPFERKMAHMALEAYLEKQPHAEPTVPADEKSYLAGAEVYEKNCAVCHGLPGQTQRTPIAEGMYPSPPQLFHGVGVTDDPAFESYLKVKNGIRMTGMPGFKSRLSESEMWQASLLVANADKLPATVKTWLANAAARSTTTPTAAVAPKP